MIDAHLHIWQLGQNDCAWPTPNDEAIYRDFSIDDVLPTAAELGVEGVVLVQSQPSERDTEYLLAIAEEHEFVRGVVGWVDLASPAAAQRIAQLAQYKKLRGLRPMLQGLADDRWILQPQLAPAIDAMREHSLCFDALIFPRHLPHLLEFAQRWPDLPVVIDHGAKPPIGQEDKTAFVAWCDAMAQAAALPWLHCKLSGLLTEANSSQGAEALQPYVHHLYQCFGPQRLMWGSDWPVVRAAPNARLASYRAWCIMAQQLVPVDDDQALHQIFSKTACTFYRL